MTEKMSAVMGKLIEVIHQERKEKAELREILKDTGIDKVLWNVMLNDRIKRGIVSYKDVKEFLYQDVSVTLWNQMLRGTVHKLVGYADAKKLFQQDTSIW